MVAEGATWSRKRLRVTYSFHLKRKGRQRYAALLPTRRARRVETPLGYGRTTSTDVNLNTAVSWFGWARSTCKVHCSSPMYGDFFCTSR